MKINEIVDPQKPVIPMTGKTTLPIKGGTVLLKYRIFTNPWPGTIRVAAYAGKQAVGELTYRFSQQDIKDMYVDQRFQRNGINTAMHEYLETLIKQIDPSMRIKISSSLSPDGAAFYGVHPKMDAGKDWRFASI